MMWKKVEIVVVVVHYYYLRDELVQRDAILLGQGADLLVERLREAQTDGAHGNTPMISSNVFGVTIAIPNCSAPRKLRVLYVTMY